MAIYHLHHGTIGRSTHVPGTARAHTRYITRESACSVIVGEVPDGIALSRKSLLWWMSDCETSDRVNARVVDKVCVALPLELSRRDRIELIREFASGMSDNRVPWVAAIHDIGEDEENPHAHIVFRDRDFVTGKRVMNTSTKGSTERLRQAWEAAVNDALCRKGVDNRVSRKSNEARGIDAVPAVHLGPAEHMEERDVKTRRGEMNRRIRKANRALEEAREIATAAEDALRLIQLPNLIAPAPKRFGAPDWLRAREDFLTREYGAELYGSELARYWKIEKTDAGVVFTNSRGGFTDLGSSISAHNGNDAEITAMLAVAKLKGWTMLHISGSPEFRARAAAEARRAGFAIAPLQAHDNDRAKRLAEQVRVRARQRGRGRS